MLGSTSQQQFYLSLSRFVGMFTKFSMFPFYFLVYGVFFSILCPDIFRTSLDKHYNSYHVVCECLLYRLFSYYFILCCTVQSLQRKYTRWTSLNCWLLFSFCLAIWIYVTLCRMLYIKCKHTESLIWGVHK